MMARIDYARLLAGEDSSFRPLIWDRYDFQALTEFSPQLASQDEEGIRRFGRSLVQDAFFALRNMPPREDDGMGQSWQQAMATDEFASLRRRFDGGTREEKVLAIMGLHQAVLQSFMTNSLGDDPPTMENLMAAFNPQGQDFPEVTAVYADVDDANDSDEADTEDGQEALAIHPSDLGSAVEHTDQMAAFVSSVGGFLSGGPPQIFEEAMEISESVDLRDFARILGFTEKVVGGASRETRQGSEELTGYRSGGLEDKTHPLEIMNLAKGDAATMIRLVEGALINREFRSNRPAGLGPVAFLRDESSSMGGTMARVRHKRALAFEMALANVFNREGRDLVSIRWGSHPAPPFVYGDGNLKEHSSSFLNHNSTVVTGAIEKAIEVSDTYDGGMDILVATDGALSSGQDSLLRSMLAPFRAAGGRVWVVVIGNDSAAVQQNLGWADHWIHVDELDTNEKMADLLRRIADRRQPGRARLV